MSEVTVGDLLKTHVEEGIYKLNLVSFDADAYDDKTGKDLLILNWETEDGVQIWDRFVHTVEYQGAEGKKPYPTLRNKWAPLYVALGGDPNFGVDTEDAQPFFDDVVEMVRNADSVYASLSVRTWNGKKSNNVESYMTQDAAEEAEKVNENPFE